MKKKYEAPRIVVAREYLQTVLCTSTASLGSAGIEDYTEEEFEW